MARLKEEPDFEYACVVPKCEYKTKTKEDLCDHFLTHTGEYPM